MRKRTRHREAKEKVRHAIARHFELQPEAIHLTSPTFFSQMTTNPAKTVHDEYWHPHVDKVSRRSLVNPVHELRLACFAF